MSDSPENQFDKLSRLLYGMQIDEYARGSEHQEHHALGACKPRAAALLLPEEYASLILTARMDFDLGRMLVNNLSLQGDPDVLLFDRDKALNTFASKASLACSMSLITSKLYDAINQCRQIRNCYAHTDDPNLARSEKRYLKAKNKLLSIDPETTSECIREMKDAYKYARAVADHVLNPSEVVSVMVYICDRLYGAAFVSNVYDRQTKFRAAFAYFGYADSLAETIGLNEHQKGTSATNNHNSTQVDRK